MTQRNPGQMIPRGENVWLLRWYIGMVDGKRKYGNLTFKGSAVQARKELSKKTVSVDEGTHVIPSNQTVGQYLDWWLENVVKSGVTQVTLGSYTNRVKTIKTALGSIKLTKLDWQVVQQFYNKLRESGRSGRTVRYTHTILKSALQHAVKGKLLKDNPCDHATPGTQDKEELSVWSSTEVQLFLERTQRDEKRQADHALWYTLLHTGLRPGEALGLKWADLDGDRLQVVRAVAEIDAKTNRLEDVKTAAGRRSIVLTLENLVVLQEFRKQQAKAILKAGPEYTRNDFIFAAPDGKYDLVLRVRKRWQRAIGRVNETLKEEQIDALKEIRLYDCRHTHATMLLQAGVHPKVVQERLGHASITITLDTYSHVLPNMQDEAVQKLRVLMGNGG